MSELTDKSFKRKQLKANECFKRCFSVWSLNKWTKCHFSVRDLTWIINIHTIGLPSYSCTCCADLPVVMSVKGPWKQMLKSFISNCWEEETIAELSNQHFNSDSLCLVCNACTRYSDQKKKLHWCRSNGELYVVLLSIYSKLKCKIVSLCYNNYPNKINKSHKAHMGCFCWRK